jgi:hypothetical protein
MREKIKKNLTRELRDIIEEGSLCSKDMKNAEETFEKMINHELLTAVALSHEFTYRMTLKMEASDETYKFIAELEERCPLDFQYVDTLGPEKTDYLTFHIYDSGSLCCFEE